MKTRKLIALLMAVMMVFAFAACSSGGEDTKDTSDSNQTPKDAKDYAALAATAVQAFPDKFGGPTEAAKAPTGIKVALIPSDAALSGPAVPAAALEEAGSHFGWQVQWYNGNGNPADQNKGIMDAVSWGADVICCFSVDARSVQQGLKTAKDAGIPVVSASNGTDEPNTPEPLEKGQIDFAFDVGVNYYDLGVIIADWIINDAGNTGSIGVFGAKEYPSCMMTEKGLLDELNTSNMDISKVMYFTGGQVGDTLNRQVIGYLQSNPDTKYIFIPYDPAAIGVCEALTTAGMTDVKVCSILGTEQMQDLIANGDVAAASAAYDMAYMGWGAADQIIRLLNGEDLWSPHGENTPMCVLDDTNITPGGGDWAAPYNYKENFLALWQ
ncbi:MAG TPA: sugar ABC transporter substrate-binding protein [Syntrophomonas sp.]|nr:sugar ABC transporter substrate-binding protein [Syntrophomonas sp.]